MQPSRVWSWLTLFLVPFVGLWSLSYSVRIMGEELHEGSVYDLVPITQITPKQGNWASQTIHRVDETMTETVVSSASVPVDLAVHLNTLLPAEKALPGHPIVFSILFTNASSVGVTNVRIIDIVPAQVIINDVVVGGAPISDTGAEPPYVWRVSQLKTQRSGVIHLTGVIDPALSVEDVITNTASILHPLDAIAQNNSSSSIITLEVPSIQFGAPTYTTTEGDGAISIEILSSIANPYASATVSYETVDGSARASGTDETPGSSDYEGVSGTIIFTGEMTRTTINVRVKNDAVAEGSESFGINLLSPRGAKLGAFTMTTLSILDDDTAMLRATPTQLSMLEGESLNSYSLALESQPRQPVTVSLSSDDRIQVTPASLRFLPETWQNPQEVTVAPINDFIDAGDEQEVHISEIQHRFIGGDPAYVALAPISVTALISDDDVAGFTLSDDAVSISEDGLIATIDIRLTSQPTAPVALLPLTSTQAVISPTHLLFDATNWGVTQTLTLAAIDDSANEGAYTFMLTHQISTADLEYRAATAPAFLVSIADNDASQLGSIEGIIFLDLDGNRQVDVGELLANVGVTLIGGATGATPVTITVQTEVNGLYQFTNVPLGNYNLEFDLPLGLVPTNPEVSRVNVETPGVTSVPHYIVIPGYQAFLPAVAR